MRHEAVMIAQTNLSTIQGEGVSSVLDIFLSPSRTRVFRCQSDARLVDRCPIEEMPGANGALVWPLKKMRMSRPLEYRGPETRWNIGEHALPFFNHLKETTTSFRSFQFGHNRTGAMSRISHPKPIRRWWRVGHTQSSTRTRKVRYGPRPSDTPGILHPRRSCLWSTTYCGHTSGRCL
ncbi:hypothetical protein BDN72DRAFT_264795 [Pluteus cervinus]|uniref:Uncharacterized protein n=1 Tax=Pluteus cervinus TaxID=181527 RepID=A0ACD3AFB8_9AGAR|nr:hypothetical protein BDN72DRAFT_264795 [Pluteus cervinus]